MVHFLQFNLFMKCKAFLWQLGYFHYFYPLHSLSSLSGNPLHCDCELQWFPEFLSSLEPGTTVDAGTCHTPADMRGLALDSLNQTQFICGKSSWVWLLWLVCVFTQHTIVTWYVECSPDCVNGSCDLLSGTCECNAGYTGETCSIGKY